MKRRHLRAKLKTNCSALFIFVLWLSLWLTSGCQKKHEQGKDNVLQQSIPSVSPNTSKALDALSRQELITALINRGDKSLSIDDTPAARWAYTLAILFDPANQTAMTTFMSISKAGTETNSDSDIRMADFVAVINEDTLIEGFMSEFPPITTVMEMVNLKMLFDERLTGNLEYSGMLLGFKDSKLSISPTRQYVPGKHKADESNNERPVDTQLFSS